MVANLIIGTVAGFVLVIDPNNEKGKRERIEYNDAVEMNTKQHGIWLEEVRRFNADTKNYDMMVMQFFTQYKREDNGIITEEEGFSQSGDVKVGDATHIASCGCGKTSWFKINKDSGAYLTGKYTCEDCGDKEDREDSRYDRTNYDGSQEREY
ncbi:hypothetical protein HY311_02875 [Candidatus Nomurabacteria bacterium]|nr:hypothetical protein [Candidatus Nomurabacteria bacterium]